MFDKTCLYTPCYLEGNDDRGNSRLERNLKYIRYYKNLKSELGFSRIILADNCSSFDNLKKLGATVMDEHHNLIMLGDPEIHVFRFSQNLTGKGGLDYPYCWRALYFMRDFFDLGIKKIVMCDSDGFILSSRLAKHIKETESGWNAYWCRRYSFPESSLQVVCEDGLDHLEKFCKGEFWEYNGKLMEKELPFTGIIKDFDCDRYGEDPGRKQEEKMDYFGQCSVKTIMEYNKQWSSNS